jgi:hypothetical protein
MPVDVEEQLRAIAFSDYSVVPELGQTGGGNWPQTDTDGFFRVPHKMNFPSGHGSVGQVSGLSALGFLSTVSILERF